MSQKKPTTNEQLAEMRDMIADIDPGKADRELQRMNNTLQRLLYAATAKYGIHMQQENGVIVTAQIPIMQAPKNHQLQWEVSADGASIMVYILQTDSPEEESMANVPAEGDGGGETDPKIQSPPPGPGEVGFEGGVDVEDEPFPGAGVGDEFEDEIKVGLD